MNQGYGPGLYNPQQGGNTFTIRARNQCGTNMTIGGGSFVLTVSNDKQESIKSSVTDHHDGSYTAAFQLQGDGGVYKVDVSFNGQSVSGFPKLLNMERQGRLNAMLAARKVEEEMLFLRKKLDDAKDVVEGGSGVRRNVQRMCVSCNQRQVNAIILPCRHYHYCPACAKNDVVLNSSCKICKEPALGYIILQ